MLAQGEDIVPIPGTKRRKYLEDNAGAVDVALTKAELDEIDAIDFGHAVAGGRYPAPRPPKAEAVHEKA